MRQISIRNYIVAGIITLLVFVTGIMLGVTTSESRVSFSEEQISIHRLELDSLQLQYLFIDQQNAQSNCAAISLALEDNVKKLAVLGDKIETFSKDINFNEYPSIKSSYNLLVLMTMFFGFCKYGKYGRYDSYSCVMKSEK